MRVTSQMIFTQFNYNLQNSMNNIYQTDEQISTGQKLNKPSDDPAAMASIVSGKAQLSAIAGYQDAVTSANQLLNTTSTALNSLYTLISNAKSIGDAATSGTAQDMTNYASLMGNVIQSAIDIANTQVNGRYIFSGYGSNNPAVDKTTGVLTATSTADKIYIQVNNGTSVNVNITAAGLISSAAPLDNTTVIGALKGLQTAIQNNDQTGIQSGLTALGNLSSAVVSTQSDIGTRLDLLQSESKILTANDTNITNNVSDKLMLSTTDIARLTVESQQQQTALTSLRSITSSVLSNSLFDFLK